MKKLFALLLTVVMMASMMVPAMAYTVIQPGDDTTHTSPLEHTLKLTSNDTSLSYNITYKFDIGNVEVIDATTNGVINAGDAVTGTPFIVDSAITDAPQNQVTYGPGDTFSADNKTATKNLIVNWNDVNISEPGIYRWKVTQTVTHDAPETPSNYTKEFYLYVYVEDNAGKLNDTVIVSQTEAIDTDTKNDALYEEYPAKTVDLSVTKTVDGNQASKDQYFAFDFVLTLPGTTAEDLTYKFAGNFDTSVKQTAYNNATTNPTEITIKAGTKSTGTFTIWLKDGQTVKIPGLVGGASYTVNERNNDGYTVTASVTDGHDDGFTFTTGTDAETGKPTYVSADDKLTASTVVTYKNVKNTTVPTGISLQSGVAFFGLVLAMGMMMLMFVGKRKEQN